MGEGCAYVCTFSANGTWGGRWGTKNLFSHALFILYMVQNVTDPHTPGKKRGVWGRGMRRGGVRGGVNMTRGGLQRGAENGADKRDDKGNGYMK